MSRHLVLTGGGTLGPVTPLLAIVEYARARSLPYRFTWLGTATGPEKPLVESYRVPFLAVTSDKFRRYLTVETLKTPWRIFKGVVEARRLLSRLKPDAVLSAGAYVSVPVSLAAWLMGIPVVLHEMDRRQGLANKILARLASLRTSVWSRPGTIAIGNLFRRSIYEARGERVRQTLGLSPDLPIVLVTGGGTGAAAINNLMKDAISLLTDVATIVHITGSGKSAAGQRTARYLPMSFAMSEMLDLMSLASVVVSRAGMGTLTELAALSKAAVLIPMPDSHQVDNAVYVANHQAAVVLPQPSTTSTMLAGVVGELLRDNERRQAYGQALHHLIPDGTATFMKLLEEMLTKKP